MIKAAGEMAGGAAAGRSSLLDQAPVLLQALMPLQILPPHAQLQRMIATLPLAQQLACDLRTLFQQPALQQELELKAALVASRRACSYLRCPNVGADGGMAAGEQAGSARCSGCRVSWFW